MRMGIVDLSSHEGIDWSKTQPHGTYRCDRGWESGGYQYGCLQRATTDVGNEHLCTEHALIATLAGIQEAMERETEALDVQGEELGGYLGSIDDQLSTVSEALWDINRTLMPLWRRMWLRARWWMHNRKQCRPWEDQDRPEPDHASPRPEMMPESELRGLDQ